MGAAHAHNGFVKIDAFPGKSTEFVAVHYVVVGLLGVEVTCSLLVGGKRRNPVGQSFLYKVVAQVHIIFRTHRVCHVYGAYPVALRNHLEHHQVAFVQSLFSCKRYHHTVGNSVGSHHHSALFYGLFVDGYVKRVGGNDMQFDIFRTYPIF